MAVINGIKSAIMLIINLGPTVMMPIIMTIIGLCLGVKFARSLKGGLLVGIGFIGLNATVSILTGAVQPAILGLIVGLILGVAGYAFMPNLTLESKVGSILTMGVTVSAVLVITPKMAAILMEGVVPVSEGVQSIIQKKFSGHGKVYIGLDCAAGIGHPVVLAMSVIMVPITLLLAIILPGNEFLPLVGLCGICFQFPLIVAITKGDFFRTFLIGIVVMGLGLYIGTNLAPLFTSAAQAAHFPIPDGAALISSIDYGSNPIPWLLVQITNLGPVFIIVVIALTVLLALWNRKQILREEQEEAQAANQGE